MNWLHKIKIKHLMTEQEDWKTIQDRMSAIADALENDDTWFSGLENTIRSMRHIPESGALEYANDLLDEMYEYCDYYGIWVE